MPSYLSPAREPLHHLGEPMTLFYQGQEVESFTSGSLSNERLPLTWYDWLLHVFAKGLFGWHIRIDLLRSFFKKRIYETKDLSNIFQRKHNNSLYTTGFCEFDGALPGKQAGQRCWSHPVMLPNEPVSAGGHMVVESSYSCQVSALKIFPPHIFRSLWAEAGRKRGSVINLLPLA